MFTSASPGSGTRGSFRVLRDGGREATGRTLSIRVHGAGPLSDLIAKGLRCSGARVGRFSHANAAGAPAGVDLMVLADYLATDPRLRRRNPPDVLKTVKPRQLSPTVDQHAESAHSRRGCRHPERGGRLG